MDSTKTLKIVQGKTLINQDEFTREAIRNTLQKVLDQQFAQYIGAAGYERTETRMGYRNGSYTRHLVTRVGSIKLHVCRDREGAFQTELFDRYQRSEKAFILTLIKMYVEGVSTRKVTKIVQELCGLSISKSLVSNLVTSLDKDVTAWRTRILEKQYPYLVFDARYEKIRENGCVVSKAVVIALGIGGDGIREVLGCWIVNSESYESWNECIKELRDRGLRGVTYVVTDENKGLRKALSKYFQGALLQRCQVHYMRNFLNKLSLKDKKEGMILLQEIFSSQTKEGAQERISNLLAHLISKRKDTVAQWLEETIEDCLQVLTLPYEHRKKMKSTNMLERLNQEIKRRSRVIRIFPNDASCLRLVSTLCQEKSEYWNARRYLPMA